MLEKPDLIARMRIAAIRERLHRTPGRLVVGAAQPFQ
jgi:hypothetical protein